MISNSNFNHFNYSLDMSTKYASEIAIRSNTVKKTTSQKRVLLRLLQHKSGVIHKC